MAALDEISIEGFKSIQKIGNLKLSNINILIGANGAGKSNFVSIFNFLQAIQNNTLQKFTQTHGGPDAFLYYGRKKTNIIKMRFTFGHNAYYFDLVCGVDNRLAFGYESVLHNSEGNKPESKDQIHISFGHHQSSLVDNSDFRFISIIKNIENLRIYHFHDTSETALVKGMHQKTDNIRFKSDAANLAAFLLKLKTKFFQNYNLIVNSIRLVAPFFDDFIFRDDEEYIQLEWKEIGNPDTPFKAFVLSDGTLRFICLATLLLQPKELMADTIIIDEPELGLHPYALAILADLIKVASEKTQLIISTQSVELINHFSPNDIIVVNRENNASTFKRLDEEQLKDWLSDYSLGELWNMNVIGGRPSR